MVTVVSKLQVDDNQSRVPKETLTIEFKDPYGRRMDTAATCNLIERADDGEQGLLRTFRRATLRVDCARRVVV